MKKNIDIYVDQINLISVLIIFFKYNHKEIHRIFYNNYFLPNFTRFIWKDIKIIDFNKFPSSKIRIDKSFFYNNHWKTISEFLNYAFDRKEVLHQNKLFIDKNNFNSEKFLEHLKEISIGHVYLPIKFFIFSKKFSNKKKTYFILGQNPLNYLLESYFNIKTQIYFNPFFHIFNKNKNWVDQPHYERLNKDYIAPKIFLIKRMILFLAICIKGVCKKKTSNTKKKICIELIQREINLNDITDLYWAKFSKTKKENMMTISYTEWDKDSLNNLKNFGIENFNSNSLSLLFTDFFKVIFLYPKLIFFLLRFNNFNCWLSFHRYFFLANVTYFKSIYESHNVKFLFSMFDWDQNKYTKAQALELIGSLASNSHWTNFPTIKIMYQKRCDILFTWSPHFLKIFNYQFKKTYFVGYPSDHYFRLINQKKENIKEQFIIGFMDNITNVDLPYDYSHTKKIYRMFFKLLKKNPNLLLYIKPKSKFHYLKFVTDSSEMRQYIDQGKIIPFFGLNLNEKMQPAKFSNNCNLIVSLGVSTAGAEASFFGIKSFHYDTMELENFNEFCSKGYNKVVFTKISNLSSAIEQEINSIGSSLEGIEENKKYHGILDPYQDGRCGERTALIIDTIFENFVSLKNFDKTLSAVDEVIIKNPNLFEKKY